MKTKEEIFNDIPFLDKNGDYFNMPKTQVLEAMEAYAEQFIERGLTVHPTDAKVDYCLVCTVPLHLHGTCCGWINANYILNPRTELEAQWKRLKEEASGMNGAFIVIHSVETDSHLSPLPEINGWISVNERLPEKGKMVLCHREADTIPDSYYQATGAYGYFVEGKWGDTERDDWKVTHWQPLPAPPKVVEKPNSFNSEEEYNEAEYIDRKGGIEFSRYALHKP